MVDIRGGQNKLIENLKTEIWVIVSKSLLVKLFCRKFVPEQNGKGRQRQAMPSF